MNWFLITEGGLIKKDNCEKCKCQSDDLFYDNNGVLLCADCHFNDFCEVTSD